MSHKLKLLLNNFWVMLISAIFFWVVFIISLAWSVMRYNYSKIPHDITLQNSIEGVIVMGIVVSAVPFTVATICTNRSMELFGSAKINY